MSSCRPSSYYEVVERVWPNEEDGEKMQWPAPADREAPACSSGRVRIEPVHLNVFLSFSLGELTQAGRRS
jgi:hypothetical protein